MSTAHQNGNKIEIHTVRGGGSRYCMHADLTALRSRILLSWALLNQGIHCSAFGPNYFRSSVFLNQGIGLAEYNSLYTCATGWLYGLHSSEFVVLIRPRLTGDGGPLRCHMATLRRLSRSAAFVDWFAEVLEIYVLFML